MFSFLPLTADDFPALVPLQLAYKREIGEDAPSDDDLSRLRDAIDPYMKT